MKGLIGKENNMYGKQITNGHRSTIKKPGRITVKIMNVQSIQNDMGRREDVFLEHLRRTKDDWDVWMVTETWRQTTEETTGIEDESDEDRASESIKALEDESASVQVTTLNSKISYLRQISVQIRMTQMLMSR